MTLTRVSSDSQDNLLSLCATLPGPELKRQKTRQTKMAKRKARKVKAQKHRKKMKTKLSMRKSRRVKTQNESPPNGEKIYWQSITGTTASLGPWFPNS